MGWLRNLLRRHMTPIPKSKAVKWKFGLTSVYFFTAWNILIFSIIYIVKQQTPRTEADDKYPSRWYAQVIGTGDAHVFRFSGLTKVGEYEISGTKRIQPGRTREEREAQREQAEKDLTEKVIREPVIREIEMKDREDLNLLVEETSSL